jgi:hypothetical protein
MQVLYHARTKTGSSSEPVRLTHESSNIKSFVENKTGPRIRKVNESTNGSLKGMSVQS